DGTSTTIDVGGTVTGASTVAGTTPAATLCGIDTATASITVFFPGGTCSVSAAALVTFQAPALTAVSPGGVQNPRPPAAPFPHNNRLPLAGKEAFGLNAAAGRNFGPVGSFVEIRFTTAGNNIWQGGARDYDTVVGQVATATTITGATPANVSTSTSILSVTV